MAIIVRLMGGLGNQMFQYAAGRAVACNKNAPLKLDLSWFAGHTKREYKLKHLRIQEDFATPDEVLWLMRKGRLHRRLLERTEKLLLPRHKRSTFRQTRLRFDPAIFRTRRHVLLIGYWQSEKYFTDIRDMLLREFAVKPEEDVWDCQIAEMISAAQAVSIHVRRGDYAQDRITQQVHGLCGLDYYDRAAQYIAAHVAAPHFFIFSDDMPWVKENLKLSFPVTFVDHNNESSDYNDLLLMSLCDHHIIANSSFSWWGAWLSDSAEKIVIAPQMWFANSNADTKDLLPDSWVRL